MNPNFNIDRPRISDEEINEHKNFKELVERFKQQSLQKARGDESWWRNKKIRYTTVIAGITVVCTVTYFSLFNNQPKQSKTNETLITQNSTKAVGTPKSAFIKAPSQKLKAPHAVYKVNNAQGGEITHPTSSKIRIPKNSFVDKNGKDIVGDVTIEYKEFHDLGDVITSGIPMAYDSAGTKYNLESAGMFDIKGSKDGEPVFIKPEKKLEVELASANPDNRFNQYYLDTVAGNWQHLRKDEAFPVSTKKKAQSAASFAPTSNQKLDALKTEIETTLPKKIDSVKVVYTTKAERLPRPKEPLKPVKATPGKPTFVLDGSYDDFPELKAFDNVIFEVGPENRNYSKELHEITWSDVKVGPGPVKGKNYILNLIYRNRSEKLIVYPVLSGNDYDKAEKQYESRLESYQHLVEKRTAEENRLMAEMQAKQSAYLAEQKRKQDEYEKEKAALAAKFNVLDQNELAANFNAMAVNVKARRLFEISRFGIYNSDCPHPKPGQSVMASPVFALHSNEKLVSPEFIYLVDHTHKTIYTLNSEGGFALNYNPGDVYSLCIFRKGKMFLCDKASFRQTIDRESSTFTVKPLPDTADDLLGFKKAIEI